MSDQWIHAASRCDAETVYADLVDVVKSDVAAFQKAVGHEVYTRENDDRTFAIAYGPFVGTVQLVPTPKDDIVITRRYRPGTESDEARMEIRAGVDPSGRRLLNVKAGVLRHAWTLDQVSRALLQPMLFADVPNL